jgi:hypothetical protein
MWWVVFWLAKLKWRWQDFEQVNGPWGPYCLRRPERKPPDKPKPKPAEAMLADLIAREEALGSSPSLFDRLLRRKP